MDLKRAAARGAIWNVVENLGNQLTSFIVFLALARLLDAGSFGLAAIASAILSLLWIFVEQGFSTAIVQHARPSDETLATAFWISAGCSILAAVFVSIFAGWLATAYAAEALAPVLRVLVWAMVLSALSSVNCALIERNLEFKAQALRRLAALAGGGSIAIAMAFAGFGVWSLVAKQVVETLVDVLIAWRMSSFRPRWTFDRQQARQLFSFGSRVVGSNVVGFMVRRSDEFLIGLVLGPVALGFYAVGLRAVVLVSEVALRAAQRTAVPVFSRLQGDIAQQRRAYYAAVEVAAAVACPTFLGLSVTAPELCLAMFGDKWLPAVPVMQILGLMGVGLAVSLYTGPVLISVGRTNWLLANTLVQAVLTLVLSAITVRWGLIAVAIGQVARGYLALPISMLMIERSIGAEWRQVLRYLVRPTFASCAMVCVVLMLRPALESLVPTLRLLVLVVVGGLSYTALMVVIARGTTERVLGLLRILRDEVPAHG